MSTTILQVKDLDKRFKFNAGFFAPEDKWVYAVNRLSFRIQENEIYGLVGESGCGKTTTARLIVRMYQPTAGEIWYRDDVALHALEGKELKRKREEIQYIFQDPARSLNPRMKIRDILISAYRYSSRWPGKQQATEEAAALLQEVGLQPDDMYRRPPDFSGGQRQRISIARALIMDPKLLICDEVVSALDVSIQSQILNLLLRLKEERNLAMLFISHDLSVVSYICDRVGVMYRGVLVEEAPALKLLEKPEHAYTRHLYSSVPRLSDKKGAPGSDSPYARSSFDPSIRPAGIDEAGFHAVSEEHRVLELDLI